MGEHIPFLLNHYLEEYCDYNFLTELNMRYLHSLLEWEAKEYLCDETWNICESYEDVRAVLLQSTATLIIRTAFVSTCNFQRLKISRKRSLAIPVKSSRNLVI